MNNRTDQHQPSPPAASVHASLRGWARGTYGDEAAVELLIHTFDGHFALPGWPWIAPRERPGESWLDADAINQATGQLSGGEQRVLAVAAALTGSQRLERSLADVMSGVDRDNQTLILAAFSHAGGSHQHNDYQRRPDGTHAIIEARALFPWPVREERSEQGSLPIRLSGPERRRAPQPSLRPSQSSVPVR